jgi:hypothetical protein
MVHSSSNRRRLIRGTITESKCFFSISTSSWFDTRRFFTAPAKRIDSVDPRYVFAGKLLLRLYVNEHLRYLRQLLQNRVLNGQTVVF